MTYIYFAAKCSPLTPAAEDGRQSVELLGGGVKVCVFLSASAL